MIHWVRRRSGLAMRLDDPQWLRRRYVQDLASLRQMAAECGVQAYMVRDALVAADVPIRPVGPWTGHLLLEDLYDAYIGRGMSIMAIAGDLRVSEARAARALDGARIPRRPRGGPQRPVTARQIHDEAWLRDAYVTQGRSMRSIGLELGCTAKAVSKQLARLGISR